MTGYGEPPHPTAGHDRLRCSAKGCDRDAAFAIRWNNPKIHPPQRRKTWLACSDHRAQLTEFLSARGMFRECEPVAAGSTGPIGGSTDSAPDP